MLRCGDLGKSTLSHRRSKFYASCMRDAKSVRQPFGVAQGLEHATPKCGTLTTVGGLPAFCAWATLAVLESRSHYAPTPLPSSDYRIQAINPLLFA